MGFRLQKRINLGKGFGLNISKTGISPSFRNEAGSFGSKGYSLKTGFSGLTYRKTFSKSSKGGCILILLFFLTISILIAIM